MRIAAICAAVFSCTMPFAAPSGAAPIIENTPSFDVANNFVETSARVSPAGSQLDGTPLTLLITFTLTNGNRTGTAQVNPTNAWNSPASPDGDQVVVPAAPLFNANLTKNAPTATWQLAFTSTGSDDKDADSWTWKWPAGQPIVITTQGFNQGNLLGTNVYNWTPSGTLYDTPEAGTYSIVGPGTLGLLCAAWRRRRAMRRAVA
jgi:hypothetical protein